MIKGVRVFSKKRNETPLKNSMILSIQMKTLAGRVVMSLCILISDGVRLNDLKTLGSYLK